jgi:anti-sigma B factor antagonist
VTEPAEPTAGTVRIAWSGALDLANATGLGRDARAALDTDGVTLLVIDLADVSFMDSTVLGELVAILTRATDRGARVRLQNVPSRVKVLLDVTGVGTLFEDDPA